MDNHIAVIQDKPALFGPSLDASFFLMLLLGRFEHTFGKRIEHAVAGAVADHEIVGKGCNVFDVEKQDVFALFVLQGVDDFMSKFECVQRSPL